MKQSQLKSAGKKLRQAFKELGLDCSAPDMQETPLRVARWLADIAKNQGKKPKLTCSSVYNPEKQIKLTTFSGKGLDELVVFSPIEYSSVCAHHLMPFFGTAAVGYLPSGKIIGASKIPRLVDFFSRQPTTQEYLTQAIADFVQKTTGARFTGVMLTGTHTCCSCRGVRKQGMIMKTSCFLPSDNHTLKVEFMNQAG